MAIPSNDTDTGARFIDAGGVQRARNAAREAVDRLSSSATGTVDRLSTRAQETLDGVADNASQYAERGVRLAADARDWIAAYPWRAVGIAAAAGFLLMRIMR